MFILDYDILQMLNFGFYYISIWNFKFSRVWENEVLLNALLFIYFLYFIINS